MHRKHIDVNEVAEFLQTCGPNTKVYIGCDSERHIVNGVWYADYITAVVIHKDGKHGCKIFGAVERDRDYDQKSSKPRLRLMNEVYRAANLYLALSEVIENDIEVFKEVLWGHIEMVNKYKFSRKNGIPRKTLYRMFSKEGNPTLSNLAKLLHSLYNPK